MKARGSDAFDLTGRIALVTGAGAGGLGQHTATALARHGAKVIVTDAPGRERDLESTVAELRSVTGDANQASLIFDVTDEAQVEEAIDAVVTQHGGLAILVHHAGVMRREAALTTTLEDWRRVIDVNLVGTWLVAKAAGRVMVKAGTDARIVTTSSIYADRVGPLPESAYYASKAAVANLTRGLAAEWGPYGITVNCVAPGVFYPTRMTEALGDDPGRLESMAKRTLLGRLGDPAVDLGGTIVWLVSDAARYVTGQIIYVDGGWSAW
jgi:gluconate 5-dehydrogenase